MAYLDDFGSTPAADVRDLTRVCRFNGCAHPRYRHGTVSRPGRHQVVDYTPGRCELCRCQLFRDESPISTDDVIDAALALKADKTLAEFGIEKFPDTEAW